jgi:hypothetical protein
MLSFVLSLRLVRVASFTGCLRVFAKAPQEIKHILPQKILKDIPCRLSTCNEIIQLPNERQLENRSISVRLNSWDSFRLIINARRAPARR